MRKERAEATKNKRTSTSIHNVRITRVQGKTRKGYQRKEKSMKKPY